MANVTDFTPVWAYVPAAYGNDSVFPQIPVNTANLKNSRTGFSFRLRADGAYTQIGKDDLINHYPLKNGKLHPNPVLFLEQKETNFCPRNTALDFWTTTRLSVTKNVVNAPDKLEQAEILSSDATNNSHFIEISSAAAVSSGSAIVSCFVHCGDREHIKLEVERSGTVYFQFFNIKTNTLGDKQDVDDAGIIEYPDGWKRVYMIIGTTGNHVTDFRLYVADGNQIGDEVFKGGNHEDIWAWGYQYEVGADRVKPSSLIETGATTSDRNKDFVGTPSVDIFNSQEGIFYVDVTFSKMSKAGAAIGICDGSSSNGVFFERVTTAPNAIESYVKVGGLNVSFKSIQSFETSERIRLAIAWQESQFLHYANGQEVHEELIGSTFDLKELTTVVCHDGGVSNAFDGFIHEIRVYNPTHLGTAQLKDFLKAITTQ